MRTAPLRLALFAAAPRCGGRRCVLSRRATAEGHRGEEVWEFDFQVVNCILPLTNIRCSRADIFRIALAQASGFTYRVLQSFFGKTAVPQDTVIDVDTCSDTEPLEGAGDEDIEVGILSHFEEMDRLAGKKGLAGSARANPYSGGPSASASGGKSSAQQQQPQSARGRPKVADEVARAAGRAVSAAMFPRSGGEVDSASKVPFATPKKQVTRSVSDGPEVVANGVDLMFPLASASLESSAVGAGEEVMVPAAPTPPVLGAGSDGQLKQNPLAEEGASPSKKHKSGTSDLALGSARATLSSPRGG